ncbi:helix-turn-helix transcriptional regulator [Microbispora sp. ATCC PTA-5024]|uniref:helix-turn-helix transcriptional regulator n=1 Tax=Microbispora sp. ATCC PTA-5024 TaxID=316330 RepID=UPI0003DC9E3A|nr:LuxR family transcriptional regulator [Microbispora sp. ATCC PTA-5024]ETK32818.1 hypothetical protein MPTA5024_27720 [Microbispora sp. ATCC PTA-5024]
MDGWDLVERDVELASLEEMVRGLSASAGGAAVLAGPAGIGKTRLLTEMRPIAERAGARVLYARGSELEREFAFGVVRQLFEPVLVEAGPRERARLLAGEAERAALLLGQPSTTDSGGEFSVLNGLFWFAANLSADQPLVLLIDDLHWADAASLRLLSHLAPRLDGIAALVVAALRSGEPSSQQHLIDLITQDPATRILGPSPLSAAASDRLLRAEFGATAARSFLTACHETTGGNPFLLRELTATIVADRIAPTAANAGRITTLGTRTVGRWVGRRLNSLRPEAAEFARAVALLGEGAHLEEAAVLAGVGQEVAAEVADELARTEVLRPAGSQPVVEFVHPLVRSAVLAELSWIEQAAGHARAARVLSDTGASAERIAAHLLLAPPRGDVEAVALLRRAAAQAGGEGSPESAFSYLRRCLEEPPDEGDLPDVLLETGLAALSVDLGVAVEYLERAHAGARDPHRRAEIGCMLGLALDYIRRSDDAVGLLMETAGSIPEEETDFKHKVLSYVLTTRMVDPSRQQDVERLRDLWEVVPGDGVGGRSLDCAIAFHDMKRCLPSALVRARRGLSGGVLGELAPGESPTINGWLVLLAADADEAMATLDAAVDRGRRRGSLRDLATAHAFRALGWLWRGALAEAEADGMESRRAVETANFDTGRPWVGGYLATALLEQGRLDAAAEALDWAGVPDPVPSSGSGYLVLEARARLHRRCDRPDLGLEAALACGRFWTAAGGTNPAFLAWRSEAAQCLHALGETAAARTYADEELRLARLWRAPRALGRALRVSGLLQGSGRQQIGHLQEAVAVLQPSGARLELAKALIELGAAQRRSGSRGKGSEYLRRGLEVAEQCGAAPVAERARVELAAAGSRAVDRPVTGLQALTPSEARVAAMAARGATNRQIAQSLYITPKTVEVHLSSAYRKLRITSRSALGEVFFTAQV